MTTVIFRTALAVCLLAGALFSPASLAERGYYKWVDADGRPHHSDRPPPSGVAYEFVSTGGGLSRSVSAEENRTSSGAAAMPPEQEPEPNEAVQRTEVKKDPALCDSAKANLDTLNSNARVRIRGSDGTIRYLTPEEKDVQRRKAQDLIAVHCNTPATN